MLADVTGELFVTRGFAFFPLFRSFRLSMLTFRLHRQLAYSRMPDASHKSRRHPEGVERSFAVRE